MTRKNKLLAKWHDIVNVTLSNHDIGAAYGLDGASREATAGTPYGDLRVHVYDDWVHFCLLDFGARYPSRWYGWSHWKCNFHTFINISKGRDFPEEECLADAFGHHVARFFKDNGFGLPCPEELSESKLKRQLTAAK